MGQLPETSVISNAANQMSIIDNGYTWKHIRQRFRKKQQLSVDIPLMVDALNSQSENQLQKYDHLT